MIPYHAEEDGVEKGEGSPRTPGVAEGEGHREGVGEMHEQLKKALAGSPIGNQSSPDKVLAWPEEVVGHHLLASNPS